jgi:hypothetical protein
MEDKTTYRNLRFERRPWAFPRRWIPVILAVVCFTVLWILVPHNALYWLLAPLVVGLAWVSTYGWRQALANLIVFLHRLEQF